MEDKISNRSKFEINSSRVTMDLTIIDKSEVTLTIIYG